MELLELVLALLAIVCASNIISQFVHVLSVPIIQILFGVAAALLMPQIQQIEIEPELFFCLLIAPLLFNDARHAETSAMKKYRQPIVFLAFPLVFLTVVAIGFTLSLVIPALGLPVLPFAVCLALGAALAPTDAVAISSVKSKASIPKKLTRILEGEALINDASGLVTFNFAVAFATGATAFLSLQSAAIDFGSNLIRTVVVGCAIGLGLTGLKLLLVRKLRSAGVENTSLHVLLEILTPFLIYIVAEGADSSGILAVVVCGIFHSMGRGFNNPGSARQAVVSRSVWSMLSFVFNGLVFILLGIQLPHIIETILHQNDGNFIWYILVGLILALVLYIVRFVWALITIKTESDDPKKKRVKEAVIISLAGVKGTVTLATAMSIPAIIEGKESIIFVAVVVIIITLFTANFLLPLVAKKKLSEVENEESEKIRELSVEHDVILRVIKDLDSDMSSIHVENAEEKSGKKSQHNEMMQLVITEYNIRLRKVQSQLKAGRFSSSSLQRRVLLWEARFYVDACKELTISPVFARRMISNIKRQVLHLDNSSQERHQTGETFKAFFRELPSSSLFPNNKFDKKKDRQVVAFKVIAQIDTQVIDKLQALAVSCPVPSDAEVSHSTKGSDEGQLDIEELKMLIEEYRFRVESAQNRELTQKKDQAQYQEAALIGFQYERNAIADQFEKGHISRNRMHELIQVVDLMEFALSE
jgi:CPA1 family monovalent cation:H+ antiporter